MPTLPGTSIIVPVDSLLGPCLIGSFLSCILYGLTLLQTYHYCCRYWGKDKLYIYLLVGTVTVLDTFGIILNIKGLWYYLIDNYGNVLSLLFIDWTLAIFIIVTALTSILVQGFYSYRLWMISGKKMVVLPVIIMLLGFAAVALCIVYMVLILRNGALLYIPTVSYLPTSALSFSLASDILVTTSMTYVLMGHKGEVRIRQTRNVLTKLVTYTIYSGSLTIVCTICALITGQVLPHTEYNAIFFFPSGKFYVNSMLAFLNARDSLRGANSLISVSLSNMGSSTPNDSEMAIGSEPRGPRPNNSTIKFAAVPTVASVTSEGKIVTTCS